MPAMPQRKAPSPRYRSGHLLRTLPLSLFAGIALTACGDAPEEEAEAIAAAEPAPVLTPAPTPTAQGNAPVAMPGAWTVNQNPTGGFAMFGQEGSDPSLSIDCDTATRAVTLSMSREASGPEAWRVDAGGQAARIDMAPVDGPFPLVAAQINPSLPIFDGFGEQGRSMLLTSPEGTVLQFPTDPGIRQIFAACR